MNVFSEFPNIVKRLQERHVTYALVGGMAMAFYGPPRATEDIDFLVSKSQLKGIARALEAEGYSQFAHPWTFKDSKVTLHRFVRMQGEETMTVDVLVAGTPRHVKIIRSAIIAPSESMGQVRVARREDMIWLKRQRNSTQDRADIERLAREES